MSTKRPRHPEHAEDRAVTPFDEVSLRIGELADATGVSSRMIRHYHHVGVLTQPFGWGTLRTVPKKLIGK